MLMVPTCLILPVLAQLNPVFRVFCGADDRSLHQQRSPWHWLPERALVTALLCNANTHFHMSRPITSTPHTLVFRVIIPGDPYTRCSSSPLPYASCCCCPYLGWEGGRGLKQIVRSHDGGLPWAVSTHTSCQSHSSLCPPAMCTVFH